MPLHLNPLQMKPLMVCAIVCVVSGCQPESQNVRPDSSAVSYEIAARGDADKLRIVECLLPPRLRRLGSHVTYASGRRIIQTSAENCEIRGGEYVFFDPAQADTYAKVLNLWREKAESGDPAAQTRVGEIYEQGRPPDYVKAVFWYRQASQQGFSPAKLNLGQLYEKGLGVEKDSLAALNLYREASGLKDQLTFGGADVTRLENEVYRLQEAVASTQQELERSRETLRARNTQVINLEQRILELNQRIEAAPRDSEGSQLHSERDKLVFELEQLRHERVALEARVASGDEQLAVVNRDLRQRDREALELEQRLQKLATQMSTAPSPGELDRLRREKAELKAGLEELRRERKRLQQRIASTKPQPDRVAAGPSVKILFPPIDIAPMTRDLRVIKTQPNSQRDVWGIVLAPAGLKQILVNEKKTSTDKNGLFHVQIPIADSDKLVKVLATDQQGHGKTVSFLFSPKSESPVTPGLTGAKLPLGKYHALVIGNKKYEHYSDLDTPINDARTVAKLLKTRYGFEQVKLLENASRFELLSALDRLRKQLTEEDNLLIFYAGHGVLVEDEKVRFSKGYWLPVNAEPDLLSTWISNDDITTQIKLMSAKHVMVVADSCYSGTLTRSAVPKLKRGMSDIERIKRYKKMAKKRSRTVLTSGGEEPVLDSLGGQHSVFAKYFITALRENDGILEGINLFEKVFKRVKEDAAAVGVSQAPQYGPIQHSGHESTDFLLAPAEYRTASEPEDSRVWQLAAHR